MKALVFNDTRISKHLGCEIVMSQLFAYCHIFGIEIVASLPINSVFETRARTFFSKVDLIIINGEGTMHGDSPAALRILSLAVEAKALDIKIVLLNSIWFDNDILNDYLDEIDIIACRESKSATVIRSHGFNCSVVPDLSLTLDIEAFPKTSESVTDKPFVIDNQRWDSKMKLGLFAKQFNYPFRLMDSHRSFRTIEGWRRGLAFISKGIKKKEFTKYTIAELCNSSLVISGRFHGCCLSILAQKPVVWFEGKTKKISGLFEDAKLGLLVQEGNDFLNGKNFDEHLQLQIEQLEEAMQNISMFEEFQERCRQYVDSAKTNVFALFKTISEL